MRDPKRLLPFGMGLVVVVVVGAAVAFSGVLSAKPTASAVPEAPLPSAPPATSWPGFPWTFRGSRVDPAVITLSPAPKGCGLGSVLLLTMSRQLGQPAVSPDDVHQFVRDPARKVAAVGRLEASGQGPADGFFTGYQYGTIELWFSAAAGSDFVFLRRGEIWEKWPRTSEKVACG